VLDLDAQKPMKSTTPMQIETEKEMKTIKFKTALILTLVFLLAALVGEVIMYERLLRPVTYTGETQAVKMKKLWKGCTPT
jgi:hypothetical protein